MVTSCNVHDNDWNMLIFMLVRYKNVGIVDFVFDVLVISMDNFMLWIDFESGRLFFGG